MRQALIMLMIAVAFSIPACSGNGGKELFETAQFEELQNNKEHAAELYEEVIKKYPEGDYRKKAQERLNALRGHK